jgi:hypothetical protein
MEHECNKDISCDCTKHRLPYGMGKALEEEFHAPRSLPLSLCSSLSMSSNDHKSLKSFREKKRSGHYACYNNKNKYFDPMTTCKPCYLNDHNLTQLSSYTHRLTTATCPTCSSDAQTLHENERGNKTSPTTAVTLPAHSSQTSSQVCSTSSLFEDHNTQVLHSDKSFTRLPPETSSQEWKHVQPKPSSETLDIFFGRPHAYDSISLPPIPCVELKISILSIQEDTSSPPLSDSSNIFPYYSAQLPTLLRNVAISTNSLVVLEFFLKSSSVCETCKIYLPSSLLSLVLSHDLEHIAQTHRTFGQIFKTLNQTMAILELPLEFHDSTSLPPKTMKQAENDLLLLQIQHKKKHDSGLIAFLRFTRSNVFTSSLIPKPRRFQYTSFLSMHKELNRPTGTNVSLSSNHAKPIVSQQNKHLTSSTDNLSETSEQYQDMSHEFCHQMCQNSVSQDDTTSFIDSDTNSSCLKGMSASHPFIDPPKRRTKDLHLNIPPLKLTSHENQATTCDQYSAKNNLCYNSFVHHCGKLCSSCFVTPSSTREEKQLKTLCSCNKSLQMCQTSNDFHASHHIKPCFYSKTSSRTPLLTLMSTSHDDAKSSDQTFLHSKKAFLCSICHTSALNQCSKHSPSFPLSHHTTLQNVCSCYAYGINEDETNIQYQRFGYSCPHLCKNTVHNCKNPYCSTNYKPTLTFLSELFNHFYFENQLPSDVFQNIFKYGTFFLFWFILLVCPLKRLFLLL